MCGPWCVCGMVSVCSICHLRVFRCTCTYVCIRSYGAKGWHWSLSLMALHVCFSQTGSLTEPKFISWVRLPSQWAPETNLCYPPPPQMLRLQKCATTPDILQKWAWVLLTLVRQTFYRLSHLSTQTSHLNENVRGSIWFRGTAVAISLTRVKWQEQKTFVNF